MSENICSGCEEVSEEEPAKCNMDNYSKENDE